MPLNKETEPNKVTYAVRIKHTIQTMPRETNLMITYQVLFLFCIRPNKKFCNILVMSVLNAFCPSCEGGKPHSSVRYQAYLIIFEYNSLDFPLGLGAQWQNLQFEVYLILSNSLVPCDMSENSWTNWLLHCY